ncbi:GDSL esterase/lipase At4g26790 [Lolium perenne]|uniref:GDSL esterase/lipase At4g26790 n=1 Tax=Lolium perenne TaxID=4522 RepID=UPI0021EAC76A|nr:GDSL esterase/lipase At4g26790-like [Lolium perenne]
MASRQARLSSMTVALLLVAAAAVQMLVVDAATETASPSASAKKRPVVPAVIVFGDSTVDTGNNNAINTVLKSNFPPYGRDMHIPGGGATGRFCNGRLPPDFVSEALGLPPLVPAYLDPAYSIQDFATGVVFASAGTGLDNRTASVLAVLPLLKEVEYFKEYQQRLAKYVGPDRAKHIVSNAAYIVSVGTNDFLENYYLMVTGRFLEFSVGEYSDFLVARAEEFLTSIYKLGARRVTFAGLPAIGCVPLERTLNVLRGGGCNEEYNQVAREYNVKVKAMIARLRAKLKGFRLAYINIYDAMVDLIDHPEKLGLENVSEGCCATGKIEMGYLCNDVCPLTCDNADKYFFWDSFHPTEKVNRFFSKQTTEVWLSLLR